MSRDWLSVGVATVAMQSFCKHVSTIEAVFSAWSVRRLYSENNARSSVSSVEFSIGDSHGKFVEDL
jgi:hypothetical protein